MSAPDTSHAAHMAHTEHAGRTSRHSGASRRSYVLSISHLLLIPVVTAFALTVAPASAGSGFSFTWGKVVQGSGRTVETQRTVATFDRVKVEDGLQVVLRQGAAQKVTVRADDNIEPLIETQVDGATLLVRTKPDSSISTRNPMLVTIDYVQLNALSINDGVKAELDAVKGAKFEARASDGSNLRLGDVTVADFEIKVKDGSRAAVGNVRASSVQRFSVADGASLTVDSVTGDRAMLSVADGASATMRAMDVKSFEASVADGASADVAGVAVQQNYSLADAASLDAQKLRGTSARARASDGSSLRLGQLLTLDVDANDGSTVRYTGDPTITRRVRDGASLKKI